MAFKVTPLPSVGAVASRPRKEPLIDTDGFVNGAAMPATLTLFSNFSAFASSSLGLSKNQYRDTNLSGGSGGLPSANHFYWYGWRLKIRTLNANLTTAANVVVPEQINRLRELGYVQFKYSTSEFINTQADELPNGTGPMFIGTTHNATTVLSLPSGVPDRRNYKDVTISGRPPEIQALEQFRVVYGVPSGFTPLVDLYVSAILEGLFLKGITG